MSNPTRSRVRPGTPTGGEFKAEVHGEATQSLSLGDQAYDGYDTEWADREAKCFDMEQTDNDVELDRGYRDPDPWIRAAAVKNPHTGEIDLHTLASREEAPVVLREIAKRLRNKGELAKLAKHTDRETGAAAKKQLAAMKREQAAFLPTMPAQMISEFANTKQRRIEANFPDDWVDGDNYQAYDALLQSATMRKVGPRCLEVRVTGPKVKIFSGMAAEVLEATSAQFEHVPDDAILSSDFAPGRARLAW